MQGPFFDVLAVPVAARSSDFLTSEVMERVKFAW